MSRVTDAYIKAIPVYCSISEANCHTRIGTWADIVSYLCEFETIWHQVLDANLKHIDNFWLQEKVKGDGNPDDDYVLYEKS